jgi:hypothetical protein
MVTTVTSYTDSRNRAYAGQGFDGVVRISVGGYFGTGELLYDGQAVLTAAHLFSNGVTSASITFDTTAGTQTLSSSQVTVHPAFDTVNDNNDLAIVWLNGRAPVSADRYGLYRGGDEIGQSFTMVGYGQVGTGSAGSTGQSNPSWRLKAQNTFDADAATLKKTLGQGMGWTPLASSQLMADFDNGNKVNDALGQLANLAGLGLGSNEGLIAAGDSGGPAFINGQIAGVAGYVTSLTLGVIHPDVDNADNSSFGEIAAWQRVSHYQQWIDQSLRAQYLNAPTKPSEVQKTVPEGNSGTRYAYFLLQFTGVRSDPNQWLSVDYATRDGTAAAGRDYLAVHGKLVLYPNENQAVIPVEVIGDTTPEPDETFYLDVTNPVGGSFGPGVVMLTAMRTIVTDDGWV